MNKFSLGVFGGGFKPFTLGHFSMLGLAATRNDMAILFYGMSGRETPGSDFSYTQQMAQEIFKINKVAIEREMSNVKVIEAKPNPLVAVFETIEAVKDGIAKPSSSFAATGIDPRNVTKLTVYDGPDDILRYTKYRQDPVKKMKYFGDMEETGRLEFSSGPGDLGYDEMLKIAQKWAKKDLHADLQKIRGTAVRKLAATTAGLEEFMEVLPPIYTEEESKKIFNLMKSGVRKSVNETLRAAIRALIVRG